MFFKITQISLRLQTWFLQQMSITNCLRNLVKPVQSNHSHPLLLRIHSLLWSNLMYHGCQLLSSQPILSFHSQLKTKFVMVQSIYTIVIHNHNQGTHDQMQVFQSLTNQYYVVQFRPLIHSQPSSSHRHYAQIHAFHSFTTNIIMVQSISSMYSSAMYSNRYSLMTST